MRENKNIFGMIYNVLAPVKGHPPSLNKAMEPDPKGVVRSERLID